MEITQVNDYLDKMGELLEKSEVRIDRTNEMVCMMANAIKAAADTTHNISNQYCTRMDQLIRNRDELMAMNTLLIKQNERLIQMLAQISANKGNNVNIQR